jgi:hypothetical protein
MTVLFRMGRSLALAVTNDFAISGMKLTRPARL